jgi:hypothetical protein
MDSASMQPDGRKCRQYVVASLIRSCNKVVIAILAARLHDYLKSGISQCSDSTMLKIHAECVRDRNFSSDGHGES